MKQLTNNKFAAFLLILLLLPVSVAMALIPEPDNVVYGTVTLDGRVLNAADTDVTLVLQYNGKKISSYTMGEDPAMQDNYALEIPVDSVLTRNDNALRTGDSLEIFYRTNVSKVSLGNVVVAERGNTIELNVVLQSADIPVSADPSSIDTDGDGISDVAEVAAGLNPLDPSDASLDSDGDGVSNLQEYINGTDIALDDIPPMLYVPADKNLSATALFTEVNLGVATAYDAKDGALTPTPSGDGFYEPGQHLVIWSVSDAAGNTATATQTIRVAPIVNFNQNLVVAEGSTVTVTAELNGVAAVYPVTIPFTVSGTATGGGVDHNLADGEVVIAAGLVGSLSFPILNDAVANEGTETVEITMGTPVNAVVGSNSIFTAQISEENIQPNLRLSADQGNGQTSMVVSGNGAVTVNAVVTDYNPADIHSFDWSLTEAALVDSDGNASDANFTFDPAGLVDGTYMVSVTVTDSAGASTNQQLLLKVVNDSPVLAAVDTDGDGINDDVEGIADSNGNGIPNYLDAVNQPNILQAKSTITDKYLLETEFGLNLSLGYVATNVGNTVVSFKNVSTVYQVLADSIKDNNYPSGLYDISVSGLSYPSESVSVVLPQFTAIAAQSTYNQYFYPQEELSKFVVNDKNAILSAPGADGYCPPPGDATYTPGLTAGNWCVMLVIEDGGPNDADGVPNQTIRSLSGVQVTVAAGGGGEFDPAFILLLILSAGYVHRRRKLIVVK